MFLRSCNLAFAGDHQRFRNQRTYVVTDLPGARNIEPLEGGVITNQIRRFAVRDLPDDLSLVQVNGSDGPVRRLHEWQAIDKQPWDNAIPAARGNFGRWRCVGSGVLP